MSRKKERVLRIRYKNGKGVFSKLVFTSSTKPRGKIKARGRILKVGKVSQEQIFGFGDYFVLDKLLEEFQTQLKTNDDS